MPRFNPYSQTTPKYIDRLYGMVSDLAAKEQLKKDRADNLQKLKDSGLFGDASGKDQSAYIDSYDLATGLPDKLKVLSPIEKIQQRLLQQYLIENGGAGATSEPAPQPVAQPAAAPVELIKPRVPAVGMTMTPSGIGIDQIKNGGRPQLFTPAQPAAAPAPAQAGSKLGFEMSPPKSRLKFGANGVSMEQLDPKDTLYANVYAKWKNGQPISPDERGFVKKYLGMSDVGMGNISPELEGIEPLPEGATKEEKDAWLKALPAGDAALVKGLSNYSLDLSKAVSMRSNARQKYAALAQMYDPTFNMSEFNARQAYNKSLKSGTLNNQIIRINTAIGHLDSLDKSFKNIGNTKYPLVNSGKNLVQQATGSGKQNEVNLAANAVADELETVFRMTGGSLEGVRAWRKQLNDNLSPEQQQASIATAMDLLSSRLDSIDSNHKKIMGRERDFSVLSPKSVKILNKLGINPTNLDTNLTNNEDAAAPAGVGDNSAFIANAKASGYSDAEIAQYLKRK